MPEICFLFNCMQRNALGTSLALNTLLINLSTFFFLFQKLVSFYDTKVACQES